MLSVFSLVAFLHLVGANDPLFIPTVIDHDAVQSIPQAATELELAWQPQMTIGPRSCHIYPAVDAIGQVSGGLKATGTDAGDCEGPSTGQCYVRTTTYKDHLTFLYAWFSPKDHTSLSGTPRGTRYDWQNVVIFVKKATMWTEKVCYSSRRHYTCYKAVPVDRTFKSTSPTNMTITGVHYKVKYHRAPALINTATHHHGLVPTGDSGELYPLLDFDLMPAAARRSLNEFGWGTDVICPLTDVVWLDFVAAAWNTPVERWA